MPRKRDSGNQLNIPLDHIYKDEIIYFEENKL